MKALVISEERRNLDDIRKLCAGLDFVTELAEYQGPLTTLRMLPVKGEVDVLLLDCRHAGLAPLGELERLMAFYPALNVVLIVDHDSPDMLLWAMRLGVREVVKAPFSREDIVAALQRLLHKMRGGARSQGRVLSFMPCKGGSGASFLATNIGYALAEQLGKRVLLVDLNLQFGDAVLHVSDRRPSLTVADLSHDLQRVDMALLDSAVVHVLPNYSVLAAPEDPSQAMDIRPEHIEALLRFARSNFDYVIVDLGRSIDPCTVRALDLSDQVYPVLQLTLPALHDARRLLTVLHSLDYGHDKLRPLLNRVERSPGALTEADAAKLLPCPIFATVANHYRSAAASTNHGIPILKLDAGSLVARSISDLVAQIAERPESTSTGLFGRLFRRA